MPRHLGVSIRNGRWRKAFGHPFLQVSILTGCNQHQSHAYARNEQHCNQAAQAQ